MRLPPLQSPAAGPGPLVGPRVASLLPSATEIVCALGMGEALVGVSHECDSPASVAGLPVLTSARIGKPGTSGASDVTSAGIDRDIRRILRNGLAIYDIDVEALARAAPDVILTQDLCEVCAVSFEDVKAAARSLANPAVRIVNLRPTRLGDILNDIREVGAALECERAALKVVADLASRIEAVRRRAARISGASAGPTSSVLAPRVLTPRVLTPRVLTIEWLDPVMVGGTWMPELVEIAGGRALVTRPGDHAPTLAREDLARLAPDVVVVKPCGFPLERTKQEIGPFLQLARDLGWPASSQGRIWLADGNAYFNRPGPRIADSLEILAACIHPEEFANQAERYAGSFQRAGPA